jgi:Arc/MetJ-type ribon-helix-helix transcriptional regulator
MALTVRLNAKLERAVNALAKERRQTRSDIVREALEQYTASNSYNARGQSTHLAWRDVIGIVDSGGHDPSATTGDRFAALVRQKARARRPR